MANLVIHQPSLTYKFIQNGTCNSIRTCAGKCKAKGRDAIHARMHAHTAVILEKWDYEGVIKTFCISVLLNAYIDYL